MFISFTGAPMPICLDCQDLNEITKKKKTILEVSCCYQENPLEGIKDFLSNAFTLISSASLQAHKYGVHPPCAKPLKPGTERKCSIPQIYSQ